MRYQPKYPPLAVGDCVARWTVIGEMFRKSGYRWMLCRCECGTERTVLVNALNAGTHLSCGCYRRGRLIKRKYHKIFKESASRYPEYKVWIHMKERCLNPLRPGYASYGARGITICERWLGPDGFVNFIADMGRRPAPDYHIDRIDSMKGYAPDNTRWLPGHENLKRARPSRHKSHCVHGHALTPENIGIGSKGERKCKTCHRERESRRRIAAFQSAGA